MFFFAIGNLSNSALWENWIFRLSLSPANIKPLREENFVPADRTDGTFESLVSQS